LLMLFGAAYANRGLAELDKGMEQEAELDLKKAIELSARLKPFIEEESEKIRQERAAKLKQQK